MIRNLFVLAILSQDDQVVLLHRNEKQSFGAGLYALVGGKVEQGERALQAIQREVQEEVGLDLAESDFTLIHTLHRKGTETEFTSLIFTADISGLTPKNNEPEKCDDMQLYSLQELPENMIPAHKQILEHVQRGSIYSEHGW